MENQQDEESKKKSMMSRNKRKELGLSCMLNTEVGAVLAVIRRALDSQFYHPSDDHIDCSVLQSLRSLRTLIFNPPQEWRTMDPSIYLSPFLDVVQSDDVPASATGVALSSILKILRLEIFDQKTPGVGEIMNSTVTAITGCRLERTDLVTEHAVMMKILQVLVAVMKHRAYVLLTDHSVCTLVNTCFQMVQQSPNKGDLLQRSARHAMQELIQIIYQRLPEIEVVDGQSSESETEDSNLESGFGIYSAVDIFQFLCTLLNVVHTEADTDGSNSHLHTHIADLDVQMLALVLINSAMELSGDSMGKHPKLLRMIQDDLFHHLIHYGTRCSNPLALSMICSTVLNIYHFLRRYSC